jgi:hypothetical protein
VAGRSRTSFTRIVNGESPRIAVDSRAFHLLKQQNFRFRYGLDGTKDERGNKKKGCRQSRGLRCHIPRKLRPGLRAKGGWAILHDWFRTLHPVLHLRCRRYPAGRIVALIFSYIFHRVYRYYFLHFSR